MTSVGAPEAVVGWVEVSRTWPGIDETAWVRLISTTDGLEPKPATPRRTGVNPFTGKPTTLARRPADPAHAIVVIGGETVGEMRLTRDGPSEILVFGDRARVAIVAGVVASRLGGVYVEVP